jgi:uncharacterized protein
VVVLRVGDLHVRGTVVADNAARIEELYEAFGRGDIESVLQSMDPQIEWNEAEHVTFWNGAPFIGPEAVLQGVFARIGETFGDTFRIEPGRFVDCGTTVLLEARYRGVAQATGKTLDVQVAHVWDLGDDGKVIRFQQYTDTWAFAEVTGQAPVA